MKINRIEARFIAPTLKKPFEIGDLNGHKRIVGSEEDGHRRDIIALQAYTSNSTTSAWSTIDALPCPSSSDPTILLCPLRSPISKGFFNVGAINLASILLIFIVTLYNLQYFLNFPLKY